MRSERSSSMLPLSTSAPRRLQQVQAEKCPDRRCRRAQTTAGRSRASLTNFRAHRSSGSLPCARPMRRRLRGAHRSRCATSSWPDARWRSGKPDESVARDLVGPRTFSARFVAALSDPPPSLGLKTEMQLATWRGILAGSGRPVRTAALAREVGVSREHLSRHFSAPGAPNLKRVIDLVRMIGAAELAKNPGLDVRDVAKILGFASSSHLAVTAQRVLGTRPASLSRLRTVDLVERFTQGRTRSRG